METIQEQRSLLSRAEPPDASLACTAVIPAFQPGESLPDLVRALIEEGFANVIVVDDGSGLEWRSCFRQVAAMGARCLRHSKNLGKGAALRTGLRYFLDHFPQDAALVTLDADGQHSADEAAQIARLCLQQPDQLVLGTRSFEAAAGASIPLRSRLGNSVSRVAIGMALDQSLQDTQCGLRGIPRASVESLLQVRGDHYEFETNMLFWAQRNGLTIRPATVRTVYLEDNGSSHFRPLIDSMRIYLVVLRFYGASIASAFLDLLMFALLWNWSGNFAASAVAARIVSSASNFALNRRYVFRNRSEIGGALFRYYGLAFLLLTISTAASRFMMRFGLAGVPAKVIADVTLSMLSFVVQRSLVFQKRDT